MQLQKEREHMDTIDKLSFDFILKKNANNEVLETIINKTNYFVDFTSDDQSKLREFFLVVLDKMEKENKLIEFNYKKDDDFNNELFETVAKEYVVGLNSELKLIFDKMNEI